MSESCTLDSTRGQCREGGSGHCSNYSCPNYIGHCPACKPKESRWGK